MNGFVLQRRIEEAEAARRRTGVGVSEVLNFMTKKGEPKVYSALSKTFPPFSPCFGPFLLRVSSEC